MGEQGPPPDTGYLLLDADRRPYRSPTPGRFGGHRRSRIYGRLDCPSALRAIGRGGYVSQRVFFADEPTAVAAGYRPCAVCLPAAYRAWKAGSAAVADPSHPAQLSSTSGRPQAQSRCRGPRAR